MWKFIKSSSDKNNWLIDDLWEICLIGRSNVGKSSLINALVNQKKLARVSKKPGQTQLINFYQYKDLYRLVDLPGYGYANISYSKKDQISQIVSQYLTSRQQLKMIWLLIDCRRSFSTQDLEFIKFIQKHERQFIVIFTKKDLGNQKQISKCKKDVLFYTKRYFFVSIKNKLSIEILQQEIDKQLAKKKL